MNKSVPEVINDDPSSIQPIVSQLKKNFLTQKTKSLAYRKQQLASFYRGLNELKDELFQALNKDLGYKDQFFADFIQILNPIAHVAHDIKHIDNYVKRRSVDTNLICLPGKSYIQPEPLGVVLVISAWNYPYQTSVPSISSAIAAGNAVVLKPSELSPNSSRVLAKLFEKYLDPQFYVVIQGGVEVAKSITRQPFDLIVFTGGTEKGKLVARAAADNLIPCILELGGKSPCIVDSQVDMGMTCRRVTQTKFFNQGQTCLSPDYVLVREDVKDLFLQTMKTTIQAFYGDNPKDSPVLNNMINEFHTQRVLDLLKDCKGEVLVGGKGDIGSCWVEPTVVVNPNLNSKLMQDEIFGPVLPVITFKSDDEVIQFVNDRPKPLALYHFGPEGTLKNRLLNETSSGSICFNDCVFNCLNSELPFGGVGASGYGSIYGKSGFDQCCHMKSILDKSTSDLLSARYPPFTDGKKNIMSFLNKKGGIMLADIKTILFLFVFLILSLVAYKTGLLSTSSQQIKGQNGDQDL